MNDQLVNVQTGNKCVIQYHRNRATEGGFLQLLGAIADIWQQGDPATRYLVETSLKRRGITLTVEPFTIGEDDDGYVYEDWLHVRALSSKAPPPMSTP